jgi:hypothetical protein
MLQATATRSALDSVRSGIKSLTRREAEYQRRKAALAALPDKLRRAEEIDLEEEWRQIEQQKRILDRLRQRATAGAEQ